jgi:hypothetical protein
MKHCLSKKQSPLIAVESHRRRTVLLLFSGFSVDSLFLIFKTSHSVIIKMPIDLQENRLFAYTLR